MKPLERRVEKLEAASVGPRMGFTLEQIVFGSLGLEVGAPARALRDGEQDLEQLVANAQPIGVAR